MKIKQIAEEVGIVVTQASNPIDTAKTVLLWLGWEQNWLVMICWNRGAIPLLVLAKVYIRGCTPFNNNNDYAPPNYPAQQCWD